MAQVLNDFVDGGMTSGWGGRGWGGGFGEGGGLFGGLLLGALLTGRRGGGLLGGGDDCGDGKGLAFQLGEAKGENAKYRDVVDATSAINGITLTAAKEGVDVTRTTGAVVMNGIDGLRSGQWALSKEICDLRHGTDMQFATLSKDMALQHCDITRTVECQTDRVVALINQKAEQDLRDRLNEAQRERDLLATGNFPISQPAHVHRHHDCDRGRDIDQINIINQNVQALGSIVGQQADALNKVIAALAAKAAA